MAHPLRPHWRHPTRRRCSGRNGAAGDGNGAAGDGNGATQKRRFGRAKKWGRRAAGRSGEKCEGGRCEGERCKERGVTERGAEMMPPLGKARREEKLAQRNARRKDSNVRKSIGAASTAGR